MGVENFIPEIWDASVMRTLEDNLVAKKVCKNYTGKVKGKGDQVHFNGLEDVTVNSYTGNVSYEDLVDGRVTLLVDQDKYYAFAVDDFDALMANVDIKGSQSERAAYQLAANADSYVMELYSQVYSGNVVTPNVSANAGSILSSFNELAVKLTENNVPEGRMWAVISPQIKGKLVLAGVKFQINNGTHGKGAMSFTDELGIDLYVSNQVYKNAGVHYVMAGSYDAIVFAEGLMKSETIRRETAFGDGVRGRLVYGAKVIKPKELAYIALTPVAETTI